MTICRACGRPLEEHSRHDRYNHSARGRARYARYNTSDKGRATQRRYRQSEKGLADVRPRQADEYREASGELADAGAGRQL